MVMVIDGASRLLKPISCSTCTSIWFIYGEVNQIDWDEISRMAAEHDDRRSTQGGVAGAYVVFDMPTICAGW
jgi:hypothetical protein